MAGSGGLWCSSNIYGETRTRPPLFPEPSGDTGDAAVSGRPLVPVITEKQQESPAFAAGALVGSGTLHLPQTRKKKLSSHYG